MQLAKVRRPDGATAFGVVRDGRVHFLTGPAMLGDLLAAPDPAALAADLLEAKPRERGARPAHARWPRSASRRCGPPG